MTFKDGRTDMRHVLINRLDNTIYPAYVKSKIDGVNQLGKNLSAYIIAGGKSSRFKQDKGMYPYNGKPMIQHVFEAIKPAIDDIIIVADDTDKYSFTGAQTIPDIIPGLGPLGGLYTALSHKQEGRIFTVPCDMPYLNSDFISYMTSIHGDYDLIIPYIGNYYQPLHAIYSTTCLPYVKNLIDTGEKRIIAFYDKVTVRKISEEEIEFYDDPLRMFQNINYSENIQNIH